MEPRRLRRVSVLEHALNGRRALLLSQTAHFVGCSGPKSHHAELDGRTASWRVALLSHRSVDQAPATDGLSQSDYVGERMAHSRAHP